MEHGEIIYIVTWRTRFRGIFHTPFRYRMDPIPYTGINAYRFGHWYKNFRMYKRERSLYHEDGEYSRNKRSPRYLPSPWDDIQRGDVGTRRSWKNKKVKRQWMKNLPL